MSRIVMFIHLLTMLSSAAFAETRVALVIGNAQYEQKPLKNPKNDAKAIAGVLEKLGFRVDLVPDATLKQMRDASRRFLDSAKDADVRLFYYAGHASQVNGKNYLAPIDSSIVYEDELEIRGLNVSSEIVDRLDKQGRLNIVILDACRNNPYRVRKRSEARGLVEVKGPRGTLIAYSTQPGGVADDAPNRPNSYFTQHLLSAMQIPGLRIQEVFERVNSAVQEKTPDQIPWVNTNLTSANQFCFLPGPGGKCGGVSAPPIIVAKAIGGGGRARSDETSGITRAGADDLSVELFYQLTDEADHLRSDQEDAMRRSAERGDTYAMTVLGFHYHWLREPNSPTLARPKGEYWYRKAADRGYAPAEHLLGWAYYTGHVTGEPDRETGKAYYELGARKGYAPSQSALADLLGGTDPVRAFTLQRKAADQGLTAAMGELAILFLHGRGTPRDYVAAEHWARKAYNARQSEQSQHILGYMYWRQLIKPTDDMDRLRLTSFAKLRERFGSFLYGVE
jgi:hypothetical protein